MNQQDNGPDEQSETRPNGTYGNPAGPASGPVYGSAGPHGAAPVPPPPPPGYAAPGYAGNDSEPTQYTPIIPGQQLEPGPAQPIEPNPAQPLGPGPVQPPRQAPPPQHPGYPQQPPPGVGRPPRPSINPLTPKEARQWAAGAHAGGFLAWIPVAPLIPAVAIYAVYKNRSPYIRQQALEAINFQICVLLAFVAASLIDALPILENFTLLVWAVSAVFAGIAAMAALRGNDFRYPFSRQFIKAGQAEEF